MRVSTLVIIVLLLVSFAHAFFDDIYASVVNSLGGNYCTKESHCPTGKHCIGNKCIYADWYCTYDSDCDMNWKTCNKEIHVCVLEFGPAVCTERKCASWKYCDNGLCRLKPGMCDTDADCDLSYKCGADHECNYSAPIDPVRQLLDSIFHPSKSEQKTKDIFDYINEEVKNTTGSSLYGKEYENTQTSGYNEDTYPSSGDTYQDTGGSGQKSTYPSSGGTQSAGSKTSGSTYQDTGVSGQKSAYPSSGGATTSGGQNTGESGKVDWGSSNENKSIMNIVKNTTTPITQDNGSTQGTTSSGNKIDLSTKPKLTREEIRSLCKIDLPLDENWNAYLMEKTYDRGMYESGSAMRANLLLDNKVKGVFINLDCFEDHSYFRDIDTGELVVAEYSKNNVCWREMLVENEIGIGNVEGCITKAIACMDSKGNYFECPLKFDVLNSNNKHYMYEFTSASRGDKEGAAIDEIKRLIREAVFEK